MNSLTRRRYSIIDVATIALAVQAPGVWCLAVIVVGAAMSILLEMRYGKTEKESECPSR